MRQHDTTIRQQLRRRLRGAAVLLSCAGLALPLLVAAGNGATTGERVVQAAAAQVGDRYEWGGAGPDSWDCSGLTSIAWREAGGVAGIPRTSAQQQAWAVPLPLEQLLPGDLVFYGAPVTHVGLYAGGGRIVDAASSQQAVVQRVMWTTGTVRYGRVPRPDMPAVRAWTPPPAPAPSPPAAGATSAPGSTPVADGPAPAGGSATPAAAPRLSSPPPATAPAKPGKPAVRPRTAGLLRGLPSAQRTPSSRRALAATAAARSVLGSTRFSDVGLVRQSWRRAGGGTLPSARPALVASGRAVAPADARVGDLVVYGVKTTRLGIYLGGGSMVTSTDRVAIRPVLADRTVRLVRLPG